MPTSFDDIIAKLDNNELWDFPGGVHPPQHKQLSNQEPIGQLPIPERLYIPLKQHIGVEGHIIVEVGQHVLKGQALTKSMNPFAVPIHAPTSGTIVAIAPHVSAHPSGLPEITIELHCDLQDTWVTLKPLSDYLNQSNMAILTTICDSGISGMGGAGFPTHIKSAPKKNVEFLIINGIECEPYISSDDTLMREHAWQIRQGIDVLNHLLNPKQVLIGIEDNKPEAIEAMRVACRENSHYRICVIPTKYPAGGEKQLIQVLTNREVPSGGLPMDVGVIMHNVGTCFAIADAIFSGKPLIQRVVTVTGQALKKRGNYWTLVGTPIEHLLAYSEYNVKKQKTPTVIMGGPMMGFSVASPQVPVVKITNCILVPADKELAGGLTGKQEQACIRCGACADVCPASLLPQQLLWHAKAKELDKAQEYNLFDCIECGACAYVCPSEIPLVHYYRIAKADVRNEQHEKQKADKARERFETRAARLIADQQARDEKHRVASEARKQAMAQSGNDAKDKIAAALARAKEKKQAQASTELPNAEQQTDINTKSNQTEQTASPVASNNQRVQAAIARAKAKKAALEAQSNSDNNESSPAPEVTEQTAPVPASNNERVQAAIARAKAKKAALEAQTNTETAAPITKPTPNKVDAALIKPKASLQVVKSKATAQPRPANSEPDQQASDKQRKIAVAVAKAKAKRDKQNAEAKAATMQQTQVTPADKLSAATDHIVPNEQPSADAAQVEPLPVDAPSEQNQQIADKKARIAAAVAKAKAKKAAEQAAKDES
ncbi:electron transport complex subunit RsxC [Paraglaciecola sp.]|uniref:electron transport complex subunit RsxC n=1 Tax=Paraglaciecola sp. TaxID=1920173 RepID=UPI0030F43BCE